MSFEFTIEPGAVAQFRRAIGIDGIANNSSAAIPPTFVATWSHWDPEWVYRPRADRKWHGSGIDSGEPAPHSGPGTSMHAEQHYVIHRDLRLGEALTVSRTPGKTWTKQSARAGTLTFSEEITTCADTDGKPVVTATRVMVVTERTVTP